MKQHAHTVSKRTAVKIGGHEEGNLKLRLVLGSLVVGVLVSIIFVSVAYRLSGDLGRNLEAGAVKMEAALLLDKHLQMYREHGSIALHQDFINRHEDAAYLVLLQVANQPVEILGGSFPAQQQRDIANTLARESESDGVLDDYNAVWSRATKNQVSLTIVKQLSTLSLALELVSKRLGVTAFITFWIAVWTALTLSSILTKKFDENNRWLSHLASHDPLTSLPNRYYLQQYTSRYFSSKSFPDAALLTIDLDGFKDVNDHFGHQVGDALLVGISLRIEACLEDGMLLCRQSGDELLLWIEGKRVDELTELANHLVSICHEAFEIEDQKISISVSIGIATCPADGDDLETLLKKAYLALYMAKKFRLGVAHYQFESSDTDDPFFSLRGELGRALAEREFILHYQPKIELVTEQCTGVEALVRWQHPTRGMIPPDKFIPLIEQSGLVHDFTGYIIDTAISQLAQWKQQGVEISVAINLSPYNLLSKQLFKRFVKATQTARLPFEQIEFELTETASMIDIDITMLAISRLKEVGVSVSMDDFGMGMSSLSYLAQLPVDTVKIDRSFMSDIEHDLRKQAFYRGIISLCHNLDKKVVAEGVETAEQARFLRTIGCDVAQGYYYSRPLPGQQITAFMAASADIQRPSSSY